MPKPRRRDLLNIERTILQRTVAGCGTDRIPWVTPCGETRFFSMHRASRQSPYPPVRRMRLAETLWCLCTLPCLQFDYAATAHELAQVLQRHHAAANGRLDLERTQALALELEQELRAGVLERLDSRQANALLMALAHLLIPVNYTRSGPFEHDLALGKHPLPGLADAVTLGQLDPGGMRSAFCTPGRRGSATGLNTRSALQFGSCDHSKRHRCERTCSAYQF